MSDKREWTAERHAAAKDLGALSGDGKRDALAEIERLAKVLGDAHAALDVEIGRGDKVTGYVFTLAERIGSVLSGLREETKRADDAEDKVDRQAREIERLKADLLLLGALKSAEVAPVIERFREVFGADVPRAPSGKRAEAERDAWERLRSAATAAVEAYENSDADETFEPVFESLDDALAGLATFEEESGDGGEPAKVDTPVRHARHDRHCMIGDGGGCSHEPGCEVEE